jgi:hypothetical protein
MMCASYDEPFGYNLIDLKQADFGNLLALHHTMNRSAITSYLTISSIVESV